MRRPAGLRLGLLGCHAMLLAAGSAAVATNATTLPAQLLAVLAVATPLLAALPGLIAGRARTAQWLALLLVGYAGLAATEVVARAGTSRLADAALLAALTEIGLLFIASRRAARPRADRG